MSLRNPGRAPRTNRWIGRRLAAPAVWMLRVSAADQLCRSASTPGNATSRLYGGLPNTSHRDVVWGLPIYHTGCTYETAGRHLRSLLGSRSQLACVVSVVVRRIHRAGRRSDSLLLLRMYRRPRTHLSCRSCEFLCTTISVLLRCAAWAPSRLPRESKAAGSRGLRLADRNHKHVCCSGGSLCVYANLASFSR